MLLLIPESYTYSVDPDACRPPPPPEPPTKRKWKKVAASSDLRVIVAARDYLNYLYCSANSGASWMECGFEDRYTSLAVSGDASTLLALPRTGIPFILKDSGATWSLTPQVANQTGSNRYSVSSFANTWMAASCSKDGRRMVASAAYEVFVSTSGGTSWSRLPGSLPSMHEVVDATMSPDGTAIYLPTNINDPYENSGTSTAGPLLKSVISADGSWGAPYAVYAAPLALSMTITCGGAAGAFVAAIGSRQVHTSTNGGKKFVSVDWDSDELVAIALSGDASRVYMARTNATGTGTIFASYDKGKGFSRTGTPRNWQDVASNTDGSKLVAVANTDFIHIGESTGTALPTRSPLQF